VILCTLLPLTACGDDTLAPEDITGTHALLYHHSRHE
jgi:hypothetical protein